MATIDEVPRWVVWRGIGCAIASEDHPEGFGNLMTVCGRWGNFIGGKRGPDRPTRICAKCRALLPDVHVIARPVVDRSPKRCKAARR